MTDPKNPRIELNPSKTHRLDFDSFVTMNLPGKRADNLRFAFKLIWLAHRIHPQHREKGLRPAHYWNLKLEIEERLSKERNEDVELQITKPTMEKALRLMRKAGYLRYAPLDDRWYFSGKAAGTLRKLAKKIEKYQKTSMDKNETDHLIHDFCFGL